MSSRGVPEIVAYTDGGCWGNPGPGGWGVVLGAIDGGRVLKARELSGGEARTTNNRMELTAAIEALQALERESRIRIVTDSTYVRDGITKWIHAWKRNGWKTSSKGKVKNVDLWQRLDALAQHHSVTWEWVKGHAGNPGNERADHLANAAIQTLKQAAEGRGESKTP